MLMLMLQGTFVDSVVDEASGLSFLLMLLQGTVFDYYVDEASGSMLSWETKVQGFQYMPDSFSNLFVPTVETTRLTYFLNSLMENKHYVMFVGNTGMAWGANIGKVS